MGTQKVSEGPLQLVDLSDLRDVLSSPFEQLPPPAPPGLKHIPAGTANARSGGASRNSAVERWNSLESCSQKKADGAVSPQALEGGSVRRSAQRRFRKSLQVARWSCAATPLDTACETQGGSSSRDLPFLFAGGRARGHRFVAASFGVLPGPKYDNVAPLFFNRRSRGRMRHTRIHTLLRLSIQLVSHKARTRRLVGQTIHSRASHCCSSG